MGGILNKAGEKITQKAGEVITSGGVSAKGNTGATVGTESGAAGKKRVSFDAGFDFKAGSTILYTGQFEKLNTGSLPATLKTNGSGQLVKSGDIAGTWLEMQTGAMYKLNSNVKLPQSFTVEFDLLTSCDKIDDISPVNFGFAGNNSVSSFGEGDIAHTSLEFFNENKITSFAGPADKYINTEYDLKPYANDKLHVSIAVNNDQMKVYLDKTKVLDAKMFKAGAAKYFFISAPIKTENDAKVYFSNLVIAQ
ncbi:hypothetical protein [Niabella drilacis]|uniref:Uncharacterized protein n=1 Tax=Niabella drilacis (strain DSM 25811 / CCM 8410 / CCUG 62505 / LMG 26954 / E90) TaxID=1285928 RepID=A0A1G6U9M9_NIADE|nr:hypothetical protein [Niabella drilacis]SDD37999.1 hypothetical protein SAMN04487894_108194 [Niabella drilacis]